MANLRRRSFIFSFFLVALIFSFFAVSSCRDTITPTQPLHENETLVSSDGTFSLGFFSPGFFSPSNSDNRRYVGLWYAGIPKKTAVWVGNRRNPVTSSSDAVLMLTANGTLLITDDNSTVFWSSDLKNDVSNPVAQLLDNGNLVVRDAGAASDFAWQSYDYLTDTLIPGMKLGWNLKSGLERNLTAWASETDPSPGNYTLTLDLRGDPQLMSWSDQKLQWRSGPWTGIDFSGQMPTTLADKSTFSFSFVNSSDEIYYTVNVVNASTLTRLVVNQTGITQRYIWLYGSNVWNLYWYTPRSQCDTYAFCGPNGVCDPNGSPMCSCLQGFEPKSPDNWALRYNSDGCVRKTKLDCRNGTDGFVMVPKTQLPDTVSSMVDMSMSLGDCQAMCSRNCLCTAYASADVRSGGKGCIFWTTELTDTAVYLDGGQDFYLRLAAADVGSETSPTHKSKDHTLPAVLGVVFGSILLFGSAVCYVRRKHKLNRGNSFANDEPLEESRRDDDMELPLFDLAAIEVATNNFSDLNKLGEGGFGPVYKGKLRDGTDIAVKRLSKTSIQGIRELKTEVMLVAKLQHRNLVRLLGCCIQEDERILVYEYMPNKSLDAFLFDKEKLVVLDWKTRYQIIVGIARGLLYLHQDSRVRIIHRDLKAGNILLDCDMNPKISDFGLARIFGEDETNTKTRRVVGTYGYMSPEYALNGIFSVKSDVFSFGVLVLEIISGKRNRGVYLSDAEEYLLGEAWTLWREGNGVHLVDTALACSFDVNEALKCIKVGLLCVQERPDDRPTMSSVVLMLGNDHALLPEPKQPGFVARKKHAEGSSSSTKENSASINDLTLTLSIAR